MLPSINSIRSKNININGKKIKIKPWTNIQLTTYEENLEDSDYNTIYDLLIRDNIETKSTLTLLERRYVLYELYMLSKGNLLDIRFTCSSCDNPSETTLDVSKMVKFNEIKERTIKTKNFIINLKQNSNYSIDLEKDINIESIKYAVSYIDSFIYKDESFESPGVEKLTDFFIDEVSAEDYDEFITKINEIQPSIDINTKTKCPHCGADNNIKLEIESFLS